jgi:uncharacterized membrane protein HdeD (DUF308 family)
VAVPADPPAAPLVTGPVQVGDDGPGFGLVFSIGIVSIVFGLVVLAWPDVTVRAYTVLVGIWLLAAGVARVISAFRPDRGLGRQLLSGIVGVVLFCAGAACLRDVTKAVTVLALLVGLAWLLSGLVWAVVAGRANGAARVWLAVLAVGSVGLGLVFLLWPAISLTVLVWLTGLGSLALGTAELVFAFVHRRSARAVEAGAQL